MAGPPSRRSMILGVVVALVAGLALLAIVLLVGNQQPVSGGMMAAKSKSVHVTP